MSLIFLFYAYCLAQIHQPYIYESTLKGFLAAYCHVYGIVPSTMFIMYNSWSPNFKRKKKKEKCEEKLWSDKKRKKK